MNTRADETGNVDGDDSQALDRAKFTMRLPLFVTDSGIGLGDAIKRVTSFVGIPACGACQARAAALNRRVLLTGRGRRTHE